MNCTISSLQETVKQLEIIREVVLSKVSNKLNDLEGNEQKIREWR